MPSLVSEQQSVPTLTQPKARINALDWVKGTLVVFMVIYHAIGYSAFRPYSFKYLSFLPPSFILIVGFLVAQVYAARYNLHTFKPYARLAIRGFKLFLLFTILNVINCILIERSLYDGLWEFAMRADVIFLSGNGRIGVFGILLPIAYFLLMAPALLWLRVKIAFVIPALTAGFFLLCFVLEKQGAAWDNLILLSAGFLGLTFGLIPLESINRFATKWVPVLLCYLAYRLCSYFRGEVYLVQMLAVVVSLLALYCSAFHLDNGGWLNRQMILLGHYSLFGYLAQIPLLRLVVKVWGGKPQVWSGVLVVMLVTSFSLFLLIHALHKFRQRSHLADGVYRAVFA